MTKAYQPITKEMAADLLSVSKRTIDNWIADSTLPAPFAIGRRVYWHPDAFFRWLDAKLGAPETKSAAPSAHPMRGRPRNTLPATDLP